ncbi:MAG: hypothetical protein MUF67_05445 [Desulfobacterales bacterium]|jgi:hypothetical protein|nr:hypothetical protein [Desulfobacterales bacterium]
MTTSPSYLDAFGVKTPPLTLKAANAALRIPRYFFDRRDHELIRIINDVSARKRDLDYIRKQYYGYFHPHGIKEMAETRSLRIAYAMVHLLTSLEIGAMDDRLAALRALRAEVLDTAEGPMPKNTARVLMQIIKEVVRARGNPLRQLKLAHDFRITASGKPRQVRKQLRNTHLLEMPQAWNQITFDDHVHDANTKGRKSSTHLIMDAWIKGIRRLRVVHYNFIEPRSAAELAEAARIMKIDIRIGIEFYAPFRGKYVNLIWVPRGFSDTQTFLCFLEEPAMAALMSDGRRASEYQQAQVMALLENFNRHHIADLNRAYGIDMPPIEAGAFLAFVGVGQKSMLHLEKFIQQQLLAAMQQKAEQLREAHPAADAAEQTRIAAWFEEMDRLDVESVVAACLNPARNPDVPDHSVPHDSPDTPALLRLSPPELLQRLASLQSGYRITLNLSNLVVEDVLELLYDCNGLITRLELFNLKDWANGRTDHIPAISHLQEAINGRNPISLKRVILEIVQRFEEQNDPRQAARLAKLKAILHDISYLQAMYQGKPIKARIGSDSTGRSPKFHGMGLAVVETLPPRARRRVRKEVGTDRDRIPIHIGVHRRHTFIPSASLNGQAERWGKFAGAGLLPWRIRATKKVDWDVPGDATRMSAKGNVITLGGVEKTICNHLSLTPPPQGAGHRPPWRYVNSHLRNLFKVVIGFVPAFATFFLTKDWWVLAYLGAFIWFGITGVRNILQSVLGGGGLRRSPLLRWNTYVSWDRIADSLLFTGFSVPLLDYLTKTVLLDRLLGITIATQPVVLYTAMALVNGLYLSTHNALRGLPRAAVFGNFFRSALSIPVAVAINMVAGHALSIAGAAPVTDILQKWAAIISKAASDLMAGIIEGTADRHHNIRTRFRDYRYKLSELLAIYAQLELLFPEASAYDLMAPSKRMRQRVNREARDLEKIITIHALDLLYFWMYQPRAHSALDQLLKNINEEERHLLITSQLTLLRQRDISQMFIDGVLGDDFARALSFYLSRYPEYLEAMKRYV